jgi:fumarate hydratase class II
VIPTAIHIADRLAAKRLLTALEELEQGLSDKAKTFTDVIKIGRTHLQDAVPVTLGQEFSGFASQIRKGIKRLQNTLPHLEELALGGTAVGTGLNAHPEFAPRVIARVAKLTKVPFRQAENLFEALACRDAQAELMGALNVLAGSLLKIGNDLRLLSSGPRAGLASSVGMAAASAPLELNIMMPLIAYETLDSLDLLTNTTRVLNDRCIRGIEADPQRCSDWVEWSLALVTPLANRIGYDKAAEIAYRAYKEKKTVRQLVAESGLLGSEEVEKVLDPKSMVGEGRKRKA